MAYRISLHLLATLWHLLLLGLALSLRKTHRYYSKLIPVCLFSAAFTAAWALGLILQIQFMIQLTWIGALWPASLYFFIKEIFHLPTSRYERYGVWGLATVIMLVGITRYCVTSVIAYDPEIIAVWGPIEPLLRVALIIQISFILWVVIRLLFTPGVEKEGSMKLAFASFIIYGIGATLTSALLPLFGEYRYLESTSYTSVIWTTFAVWYIFYELQKQNRSLMELDVMKKELINHVTHEFRTPLDTITSALDIIGDELPKGKSKITDYTKMMKDNTQRLSHFVDELLNLAAIQQARVRLEKNEVDLSFLTERIISRLKPLAEKNGTTLSLTAPQVQFVCDEEKMEQVISNLISNAIKATPGGSVTINIQSSDEKIDISVTDDGVGISSEHLNHLFSSFYRIAIKSSSQKGSGLGLAIAKGWVEAHGGEIHAESDGPGKGSRFWFTLPK